MMATAKVVLMNPMWQSAMILVQAPVMVPAMDRKYELVTAVTRTPAKVSAMGQM